jgi:hypothetical protein
MARLLEDLEPGTPVYLGNERVGFVRGVYAEGSARLAEYVAVEWTKRGSVVLIPTKDVLTLEDKGVILMGDDARPFAELPDFDAGRYPTIRQIA